jgi:voltage-gated potassium channel
MILLKLLPILMITLVYGLIYSSIHRRNPDAFGFKDGLVDPFYFSFTTMSSVGYGDFFPKTRFAKTLVMSQQFLLIGEVVSLLGLDNINKLT